MKLPGDKVLETYIDDEGINVTVIEGYDGKIYHCWEMPCSNEVERMIKNGAKREGVEEWEYVNMALEAALKQYKEEQTRRAFIEEISE